MVERLLSHAVSLANKFDQCNETRYIDETIALDHHALDICTPGHSQRGHGLFQFSQDIWARYKLLGGIVNINEATMLGQQVQQWTLNNLTIFLTSQCKQLGGVQDLDDMINFGREAPGLRPPGHPGWSMSLNNLAHPLWLRYKIYLYRQ